MTYEQYKESYDSMMKQQEKINNLVYNQALEDVLNVVEWDGYTLDIKKRIEQLKR